MLRLTTITTGLALLSTLASAAELFEGARLIVDARRAPIENAAFLVDHGRIVKIGARGSIKAEGATRVDLTGKTVMPALIDAHIHIGYQKGLDYSADNFTRENVIDHLNRYAYAGVAAVLSLGTDLGEFPFELRAAQAVGKLGGALYRTAGRGFAMPNAGPNVPEMKASAYGVTTEEEARRMVRAEIARKVDFIKIWVDDRNGTVPKLKPELYRAIIDESHKRGVRVIAHIFYLQDAKDLARAGIDGFAHLVRDRDLDEEAVALIKQKNVFIMPNMSIGDNAAHASVPAWFDEPLLNEVAPAASIARARAAYNGRSAQAVERAQASIGIMQRGLKKLHDAGARVGYGTDDGAARDHFYAFTPHRELRLMVDSGLTPAQALTAATVTSAAFLKLDRNGTLDASKSADFVVLDANPLENIANTARISRVYLRGQEVDRAALRAGWR